MQKASEQPDLVGFAPAMTLSAHFAFHVLRAIAVFLFARRVDCSHAITRLSIFSRFHINNQILAVAPRRGRNAEDGPGRERDMISALRWLACWVVDDSSPENHFRSSFSFGNVRFGSSVNSIRGY